MEYSLKIRDLVQPVKTVSPETHIWEVKKILEHDEPLSAVVVVDDKRPIGLVVSIHLDRTLSQLYGVSVYSKRPVRLVMDPYPMMVEQDEPLDAVAHRAMEREMSKIYDQVVVTENGRLMGIVSIREMINTLAIQETKRAEGMTLVNRRLTQEIVERKKAEENLKLANERLQELDKMKTDFLSTISHELRSPMTSILGFTEIIRARLRDVVFPIVPSSEPKVLRAKNKINRNLDIILSEGERLTKLINDLRDIAKLESGRVEFHFEHLEMKDVLDRAVKATTALLEKKGLSLHVAVEEEIPPVRGDRDRLIQVVVNLLSNAIKFTERGWISCRLKYNADNVVLEVMDTGAGIHENDMDLIFERFKQAGENLTEKPYGTGLGLPICKQIVQKHGGRIWASSELGNGSTFTVTLPPYHLCDLKEKKSI